MKIIYKNFLVDFKRNFVKIIYKKIFFLGLFFLVLTSFGCEGFGDLFKGDTTPTPTPTPIPTPTPQAQTSYVDEKCEFYRVQSLIIKCHKEENLFVERSQNRKDIIEADCFQFSALQVWGGYDVFIKQKYLLLLNSFKGLINTTVFKTCLQVNYGPFEGPIVIEIAFEQVVLGYLNPEVFTKCYKEQLDQYGQKNSCIKHEPATPQTPPASP